MKKLSGARNTLGFSTSVHQGVLPPPSHLTYQGLFNELKYDIGLKTEKTLDMSFGYSRFQFTASHFDSSINDYLAMFVKGKSDGQDRSDEVRLNVVICLDVSGSMSCGLGGNTEDSHQNRLSLSLQAIRMLISKLKPNDSVSFVVFNNHSQVIFDQRFKKQLGSDVYELLNNIRAGGGTDIIRGFQKSRELLLKWIGSGNNSNKSQNRIILLTDVNDNSLSSQKQFIEKTSNQDNISTSIIGISTQFQSEICECFKDIKGFNYFCAVKQEDIKKYVFQTFDFGFFPSAFNLTITIDSEDIKDIQVFGTPDSDKVQEYRQQTGEGNFWVVSKMKSCFPSEVEIHGDTLLTVGGLILIKLQRKSKEPFFAGKVSLAYDDPQGNHFDQAYNIKYEFHPEEQFFSNASLRQAIQGFVFTSELRTILKHCAQIGDRQQIYDRFWPMLSSIENLCPKSKLSDLNNIKKIIASFGKNEKEVLLESAK